MKTETREAVTGEAAIEEDYTWVTGGNERLNCLKPISAGGYGTVYEVSDCSLLSELTWQDGFKEQEV